MSHVQQSISTSSPQSTSQNENYTPRSLFAHFEYQTPAIKTFPPKTFKRFSSTDTTIAYKSSMPLRRWTGRWNVSPHDVSCHDDTFPLKSSSVVIGRRKRT